MLVLITYGCITKISGVIRPQNHTLVCPATWKKDSSSEKYLAHISIYPANKFLPVIILSCLLVFNQPFFEE